MILVKIQVVNSVLTRLSDTWRFSQSEHTYPGDKELKKVLGRRDRK